MGEGAGGEQQWREPGRGTPGLQSLMSQSQEKGECTEGGVVAVPSASGGWGSETRREGIAFAGGVVRQPKTLWGGSHGAPKLAPTVLECGVCRRAVVGGTTGGRDQRPEAIRFLAEVSQPDGD